MNVEIRFNSPIIPQLTPEERDEIFARAPEGASYALVEVQGGDLAVSYYRGAPKFERIRRITGYLVGTLDRWNDAKKAEERDRVKHLSVSAPSATQPPGGDAVGVDTTGRRRDGSFAEEV